MNGWKLKRGEPNGGVVALAIGDGVQRRVVAIFLDGLNHGGRLEAHRIAVGLALIAEPDHGQSRGGHQMEKIEQDVHKPGSTRAGRGLQGKPDGANMKPW